VHPRTASRILWPRRWVEAGGRPHVPVALLPEGGGEQPVPVGWEVGRPRSRSGRGVEERGSRPPLGVEPLSSGRPARSQSLCRLSHSGSFLYKREHFYRAEVMNAVSLLDNRLMHEAITLHFYGDK
jgi:hypothetical protein